MYLTNEAKQEAYEYFIEVKKLIFDSEMPEACKNALYHSVDNIFSSCEKNKLLKVIRRDRDKIYVYIQALYDAGFITLNLYNKLYHNINEAIKKANEIYINEYKGLKEVNKY